MNITIDLKHWKVRINRVQEKYLEYLKKCYSKNYSLGVFYVLISFIISLIVLGFTINTISLVISVFTLFIIWGMTWGFGIIGLRDEFITLLKVMELASDDKISPETYYRATFDFVLVVFDVFSGMFVAIGSFAAKIAVRWFPVLEEINIDLSWLLVDFSRIFRTFFNLIQFTVIFLVARRIKQKIRGKFANQTTDWTSIKHF